MIYASLKPVPRWHNGWTPTVYLLASLMSGAGVAYACLRGFGYVAPPGGYATLLFTADPGNICGCLKSSLVTALSFPKYVQLIELEYFLNAAFRSAIVALSTSAIKLSALRQSPAISAAPSDADCESFVSSFR